MAIRESLPGLMLISGQRRTQEQGQGQVIFLPHPVVLKDPMCFEPRVPWMIAPLELSLPLNSPMLVSAVHLWAALPVGPLKILLLDICHGQGMTQDIP